MRYQLSFLREIEEDVQDTYDWYEEQSDGLGNDFLLSTEATLKAIERNPFAYQVIYKAIRKANTKRFPFGVFYIVNNHTITVIAIIHLSRHPRSWKGRNTL